MSSASIDKQVSDGALDTDARVFEESVGGSGAVSAGVFAVASQLWHRVYQLFAGFCCYTARLPALYIRNFFRGEVVSLMIGRKVLEAVPIECAFLWHP